MMRMIRMMTVMRHLHYITSTDILACINILICMRGLEVRGLRGGLRRKGYMRGRGVKF